MRLLITAGPTREPIDSVRFISNRSSGRMGVALFRAAHDLGHEVTLLLGAGPADPVAPAGCRIERFETFDQLHELLKVYFPSAEVLIMAAAVSDFRPTIVQDGKLPRRGTDSMSIRLEQTPDLVAQMASEKRADQRIIAFALEEQESLEVRAEEKLHSKQADMIIANSLGTMESEDIDPIVLTATGDRQAPGAMQKIEFARWLISRLDDLNPAEN